MKRVYLFFAVLCVFASLRCDVAFASQAPYPAPAVPYAELETGDSIVVKMAGAKTTTEPTCYIAWVDTQETNYAPNNTKVSFNDTTEVTALAAPATGFHRLACSITVCNIDTVSQSISVAVANGANRYYLLNAYALAANATVSLTIGGTVSATPLALPVTVPNGGTGDTSLTAHGVLLGEGTSNVTVTAAGAPAQLLLGQGAADPTWNTMSKDATLSSTGALTLAASNSDQTTISSLVSIGTITTGVWNGTIITPSFGGSGVGTLTAHGVLVGEGTGNFVATAVGTAGQPLQSNGAGVDPSFAALNLATAASITGNLPLGNGGTNAALTASNGGIVYSNASAFAVLGGTATANKILYSGSNTSPAWSTPTFPVTAAASGNLIIGDGSNWNSVAMSNDATISNLGVLTLAATNTHLTNLPNVTQVGTLTAGSLSLSGGATITGVVPIANGGTNSSASLGGNRPVVSSGAGIVESSGYLRKTAAYTVNTTTDCDGVIDCDTTSGGANATIAISLPAASSVGLGYRITIGNSLSAAASTVHTVTVAPNGTDCIDGVNVTHTLNAQYSKMTLRSTGVAGSGTGKGWIVESANDSVSSRGITTSAFGNGTYGDITSITLTPGEWYIDGLSLLTPAGASVVSFILGISTTSGNSSAGMVYGDSELDSQPPTSSADSAISIPGFRALVTVNTTYYLKGRATYTVATPTFLGGISARRVR